MEHFNKNKSCSLLYAFLERVNMPLNFFPPRPPTLIVSYSPSCSCRTRRRDGIEHAAAAADSARVGQVPELLDPGGRRNEDRRRAQEQISILHHKGGR
jgi:hypothetical protein